MPFFWCYTPFFHVAPSPSRLAGWATALPDPGALRWRRTSYSDWGCVCRGRRVGHSRGGNEGIWGDGMIPVPEPAGDQAPAVEATAVVRSLRAAFQSGLTRPLSWRYAQLAALRRLLVEQEDTVAAALHSDLGKPALESYGAELSIVIREIDYTVCHLRRWLRPEKVSTPRWLTPARAWVIREPLGVVLIIAPWNYPVQLLLTPLVGALAAGNCAVLRPSELAPAVSHALASLFPRYLDQEAVHIVEGGVPSTTALLEQHVDHIFFTGSARVGRMVMAAAARHLTPVTLELGGKCPAIVTAGTDLTVAAKRIVFGKFLNAGQTCVAPDYVLSEASIASTLECELAKTVRTFFGSDPARGPDYARIVDEPHWERLVPLLWEGRLVVGGRHDRATRYIEPTVLADVDPHSPLMMDEIFGPILPVLAVPDVDTAIAFVNERPKPLAIYSFAGPQEEARILHETSSGAVGCGLASVHLAVPGLPFGGVGESGMGAYHGKSSVEAFSHRKAVLRTSLKPDTLRIAYPRYTAFKRWLLRRLL